MWKELLSLKPGFTSITNMQQMTSSICSSADIWNYKELTDRRDSNKYMVVKLEDGNCWMTQNLRIFNKAITSADSDVTSNYTVPASSAVSSWGSSNTQQKVHYANNITNGAYYSWCAATANTCQVSGTAISSGDASSSICPKGWRLPTKVEMDSFITAAGLSGSDGSTKIMAAPYNFPEAGLVTSSSLQDVGSGGYWSSTTLSDTAAYRLSFFGGKVTTVSSTNVSRYFGYSVLCIAK